MVGLILALLKRKGVKETWNGFPNSDSRPEREKAQDILLQIMQKNNLLHVYFKLEANVENLQRQIRVSLKTMPDFVWLATQPADQTNEVVRALYEIALQLRCNKNRSTPYAEADPTAKLILDNCVRTWQWMP